MPRRASATRRGPTVLVVDMMDEELVDRLVSMGAMRDHDERLYVPRHENLIPFVDWLPESDPLRRKATPSEASGARGVDLEGKVEELVREYEAVFEPEDGSDPPSPGHPGGGWVPILLVSTLSGKTMDPWFCINGIWRQGAAHLRILLGLAQMAEVRNTVKLEELHKFMTMLAPDSPGYLGETLTWLTYSEWDVKRNCLGPGWYAFIDCVMQLHPPYARMEFMDEVARGYYLTEKDGLVAPTAERMRADTEADTYLRDRMGEWFPEPHLLLEVWTRLGGGVCQVGNPTKDAVYLWGLGDQGKTKMMQMLAWGLGYWHEPLGKAEFIQPNAREDATASNSQLVQLRGKRFITFDEVKKPGQTLKKPPVDCMRMKELTGGTSTKGRTMANNFESLGPFQGYFLGAGNSAIQKVGCEGDPRSQAAMKVWKLPCSFKSADVYLRFKAGMRVANNKHGGLEYMHRHRSIEPQVWMQSRGDDGRYAILRWFGCWFHVYKLRSAIDAKIADLGIPTPGMLAEAHPEPSQPAWAELLGDVVTDEDWTFLSKMTRDPLTWRGPAESSPLVPFSPESMLFISGTESLRSRFSTDKTDDDDLPPAEADWTMLDFVQHVFELTGDPDDQLSMSDRGRDSAYTIFCSSEWTEGCDAVSIGEFRSVIKELSKNKTYETRRKVLKHTPTDDEPLILVRTATENIVLGIKRGPTRDEHAKREAEEARLTREVEFAQEEEQRRQEAGREQARAAAELRARQAADGGQQWPAMQSQREVFEAFVAKTIKERGSPDRGHLASFKNTLIALNSQKKLEPGASIPLRRLVELVYETHVNRHPPPAEGFDGLREQLPCLSDFFWTKVGREWRANNEMQKTCWASTIATRYDDWFDKLMRSTGDGYAVEDGKVMGVSEAGGPSRSIVVDGKVMKDNQPEEGRRSRRTSEAGTPSSKRSAPPSTPGSTSSAQRKRGSATDKSDDNSEVVNAASTSRGWRGA